MDMTGIEILMDEHRVIERLTEVMRKMAFLVVKDQLEDYKDFSLIVEFIKNYSDGHHHRKEELMLFDKMIKNLGIIAEKTIKYGMLAEHDLARLYVNNIQGAIEKFETGNEESKIDIIGNTVAYADLLKRHAEKEDNVIYKFAMRELTVELMNEVDEEINKYEKDNKETRERYLNLLSSLENKYNLIK